MTTTSRRYEPGDLIYESKPYIRVIQRDLWETSCSWCLKQDVELKRCSRCKMVRYCGVTCQKAAWKDHKLECPFLPRYTAGPDHFFVQMLASLILKTKVMTPLKNFQLKRKPWFSNYLKVTEIALKSYLGEENVPNEETLLQLIGKVECNYYSFGEGKSNIWALSIG
ncbi:hypothetical protein AVEN_272530-1 [Araneus ventricosus]|uniref:MYND-type domain-containing protein n=1 Tax=Araneus ventricosus TaxID=182803 RepID=A0A4Y2EBX9_ARAVE|nr:hypothetical protein AVEN_272530-1 [Araneus ventricosus]